LSSILILPAEVSRSTWGLAAWAAAATDKPIAARMNRWRRNIVDSFARTEIGGGSRGHCRHFLAFGAGAGFGSGGLGAVLDGATVKSSRTSASFACALLLALSSAIARAYSALALRE